ncbi:MAG: ABC transporter substrate-binding protein [Actinomycetota bacterium]
MTRFPARQSINTGQAPTVRTRWYRRLLGVFAALAVIAAGCGGDDDGGTASDADETSASASTPADDGSESTEGGVAAAEPEVRLFVDDLGREVEIPADPQRVVFSDIETAAHLTTLGFVPVGVGGSYTGDAAADLEAIGGATVDLGGMADVGDFDTNLEAIAAAEPDLIIWYKDEAALPALSEIAPTIQLDARANGTDFRSDNDGPRCSKQRSLAEIVGLEDALDAQIAEYEALFDDVRARHGDTIDVVEWTLLNPNDSGEVSLYNTPTFAYNAVLRDLGMTPAASHEQATEEGIGVDASRIGYATISEELVPRYGADLIFVGRTGGAPIEGNLAILLDATEAGAADQVVPVDVASWTFHVLQAEINVLSEVDAILSDRAVVDVGDFD